jgi:hypothetical protein
VVNAADALVWGLPHMQSGVDHCISASLSPVALSRAPVAFSAADELVQLQPPARKRKQGLRQTSSRGAYSIKDDHVLCSCRRGTKLLTSHGKMMLRLVLCRHWKKQDGISTLRVFSNT